MALYGDCLMPQTVWKLQHGTKRQAASHVSCFGWLQGFQGTKKMGSCPPYLTACETSSLQSLALSPPPQGTEARRLG